MMYRLARPLLFRLEPERVHNIAKKILNYWISPEKASQLRKNFPEKPVTVFGLNFPNPVGLAAGFDKDAQCVDALWGLGFGFIEVGTVTPRPQSGNPRPRMFRVPQAQALINRMGFNSQGVDYLVSQLKNRKLSGIVGVNLGKNFDTPLESAVEDYVIGLKKVYSYANYIVINVSSPNTPGLRDMQHRDSLEQLVKALVKVRQELTHHTGRYLPLLVKLTVDLEISNLFEALDVLLNYSIDGVVCSNTTTDHSQIFQLEHGREAGGVSGKPLFAKAHQTIDAIYKHLQGRLPIVAVGGIHTPDDALRMFDAGASLIQLYTGLIYQGPSLVRKILEVR